MSHMKMAHADFAGAVLADLCADHLTNRLRAFINGAHTVAIEIRWAEGRRERVAEIAAEFVQLIVLP
jgi:hypothetical protein